MASEQKRPSINKVPIALPKADTSQTVNTTSVSQEVGLQQAVGSRARITTNQPNQTTVEGTIYVADSITNLVVLNTAPVGQTTSITPSSFTAPPGAYRIIPISQISSFQLLNLPQQSDEDSTKQQISSTSTNSLDTAALNARLQRNVAAAQATQARQGPKGTTSVDQALFDGLARLYPTRWQGNSIVISDNFIVDKPYDPKNVKLMPGGHGDLDRVRKVVERQKTNASLRQPIATGNGALKVGESQRKGG